MLQKEELRRYNRQLILPELGLQGQEKIKGAKVLMIGAGGLGCPVLQYLVAAGVGLIGVVDDDAVDESNLHRQVLYSLEDVGFKKADLAVAKLQKMNPFVKLESFTERLVSDNAQMIFANYDLVIDGSDNFSTRYLVNDTCVALNIPLVFGSIFKFEGQVAVFNYNKGPQYRDVFPEAPIEAVPNCAEVGVIGVLPGIIGTLMANEAIKIITGMGEVLSGKLLTFNALNSNTEVFRFTATTALKATPTIEPKPAEIEVNAITISGLMQQLSENPQKICLVDVREEYEYEDFNIGGFNIPLYELLDRVDEIPKTETLVFCCSSSQRSKLAIELIKPYSTATVLYLKGGVLAS